MAAGNFKIVVLGISAFANLINCQINEFYKELNYVNYRVKLIGCIAEKGPCEPSMQEIKPTVVRAILNACHDCTPFEKEQGRKIVQFLQRHHPMEWLDVFNRYIY